MADLGIKAFKSHTAVIWGLVYERDLNSDYIWRFSDAIVNEAARYSIEPILTLSPLRLSVEDSSERFNELPKTNEEMKAYKLYVRVVVARYRDKVDAWQIVNELSDHWWNTAENYAKLLRITVEEVRKIQPEARFVFAAPSLYLFPMNQRKSFVEDVLKALQPYPGKWFDYFDLHVIGRGHPSENMHLKLIKWHSHYKELLVSYGYDDVGWFTEINSYGGVDPQATPDIPYVSERKQAIDLLKKYFVGAVLGFDQIHNNGGIIEGPHSVTGPGGQPRGRIYDALVYSPGVNQGRSSKKLAYYSLKKVIEKLEDSDWDNTQIIEQEDGIYKFTKNNKPIWVAWNDSWQEKQIIISGMISNQVKTTEAIPKYESGEDITDYNTAFNTETKTVSTGKISITLGDVPVFMEEH